nr:hypothetical protein [Nitrosomonas nitrosa]
MSWDRFGEAGISDTWSRQDEKSTDPETICEAVNRPMLAGQKGLRLSLAGTHGKLPLLSSPGRKDAACRQRRQSSWLIACICWLTATTACVSPVVLWNIRNNYYGNNITQHRLTTLILAFDYARSFQKILDLIIAKCLATRHHYWQDINLRKLLS